MSSENSSSSSSSSSRSSKGPTDPTDEKTKPCGCDSPPYEVCVNGLTDKPVQYATGALRLTSVDLASDAFGLPWGHTRSYTNLLSVPSGGVNGAGWLVREQKYLVFVDWTPGPTQPEEIAVVVGGGQSLWFVKTLSGGYEPQFGGLEQLAWDEALHEYVLTDRRGWRTTFFDHTTSAAAGLEGRLKQVIDPAGRVTNASYDSNALMTSFEQDQEGQKSGYYYTYTTAFGSPVISEVRLAINGQNVRRAVFSYYGSSVPFGSTGDLQLATVEEYDVGGAVWRAVRRQHYRYYKSGQPNGFEHGLKYVVGSGAYELMVAAGLNPLTASEAEVANFADNYFEYDSQRRVTVERVYGGRETTSLAYVANPTDPGTEEVNVWATKTTEVRPDGNEVRVYTNKAGQVLVKILEETATGNTWSEYWEYDEGFRLLLQASPSAVESVTEPSGGSTDLIVVLRENEGLLEVWEYYADSDPETGAVEGRLYRRGVQKGSEGAVETNLKLQYTTQTVGGTSINPVAAKLVYPVLGAPDEEASKTAYGYTWYLDGLGMPTFQILQQTTTLPEVSEAQNGTGESYVEKTVYDVFGQPVWLMNGRGVITYKAYEEATGALRQVIQDVDTTRMTGVPLGWETLPGFGLHLVTDYISDSLGRVVQERGPWHEVQIDLRDTSATPVRRVQYTVYNDVAHEVRRAQGYMTGQGVTPDLQVVGGVSLTRLGANGQVTDEIVSSRTCGCGPLSNSEALPQEKWSRWAHFMYDAWGRSVGIRVYHSIPASGEGEMGTNYLETSVSYDIMGRINRTVDATQTIDRRVFDVRGLVVEDWVGTNDAGATESDPAGGGAGGNNMRQTTANQYDNGLDGGDGNLTELTVKVDADASHDRISTFGYDYRNRQTAATAGDGAVVFISALTYDNLDKPLQTTRYHTSVASGNRTAQSRVVYDAMGRIYRDEKDGVDLATGDVTQTLAAQSWYDGANNVIKASQQGQNSFTKTAYDGLNRITATYIACVPGTIGVPSGDTNDVSADTVLEQKETVYDAGGNAIVQTERRRLHDATGTGALQGPTGAQPQARVNWVANWPDVIGRERVVANYGTNGGAVLNRPEVAPERSETLLVTTTLYKDTGESNRVIDPMGHETRWDNDNAGRRVRVIKNYVPGCPEQSQTSEYAWHASGQLERLTLLNEVTGNQVTRWIYGTTLADSDLASNNLLRAKIYPESDDRPAPLNAGPDGIYARLQYGYNRQAQSTTFTDADGTVHEYVYDKLGRLLDDQITTLAAHLDGAVRCIGNGYDLRGLPAKVTSYDAASGGSVVNEVEFVYDAFGNLKEDWQSHSGAVNGSTPKVGYTRTNGANNTLRLTRLTYPNGETVDPHYGPMHQASSHFNRVEALKAPGDFGDMVEYTYAGVGWQVEAIYNGQFGDEICRLTYKKLAGEPTGDAGDIYNGYDRFNRTVDIRWRKDDEDVERIQYGFNANSWRTWRRRNLSQSWDQYFGYDGLGQVTQSQRGDLNLNLTAVGAIPQQAEQWQYDPTGNWQRYQTFADGIGVLDQPRVYDRGNRLMQVGDGAGEIRVDRAGRMLELPPDGAGDWAQSLQVKWDAWSRIVEVKQAGTTLAKYGYDGLTRRITREVDGVVWHCYYSDQWRPLEESEDEVGSPTIQYYWGARHRDDLVRRDRATVSPGDLDERRYVMMDYYSPASIADESGAVTERYAFSSFGIRQILTPTFGERNDSECAFEFAFQGQFLDAESGLLDYGHRYYSPQLGRWLSKDPIGVKGGLNLYAYVRNNAVNLVDFLGFVDNGIDPGSGLPLNAMGWPILPPPGQSAEECLCLQRGGKFLSLAQRSFNGSVLDCMNSQKSTQVLPSVFLAGYGYGVGLVHAEAGAGVGLLGIMAAFTECSAGRCWYE